MLKRQGFIPINIAIGLVGLLIFLGVGIYLLSPGPTENNSVDTSSQVQSSGDPIIYSVSPNKGSLVDIKVMIIRGANFNIGKNTVYFQKPEASYSSISVNSPDGTTITFNPCDNRTTEECRLLEKRLGTGFDIIVQRTDGRKSDSIAFTIPSAMNLEIISPKGGETMCLGDKFEIKWTHTKLKKVELIIGSYILEELPADFNETGEKGSGSYIWTVGNTQSGRILREGYTHELMIVGRPTDDSEDIIKRNGLFSIIDCRG